MPVKFLDLQSQYHTIKPDIDAAIESVIRESSFIGGKHVAAFEERFAEYHHVNHCIGVGNGTDALEIAIEACSLPPGSEIIVPGNSFIATAEAVTRAGHRVVFADVDPGCYTLTANTVLQKVTARTAAIIAVHLYGHPCDMGPLTEFCSDRNLVLIEDCAQAHGAEYCGRRIGGIGHIAAFSFYPGKNLGAYGDGGAVTTQDEELARRARMIANHGRLAKYDHEFEGRNSRLDGLQAAILNVKLSSLDAWTRHRIEVADVYLRELADLDGLTLPVRNDWARQVYHLFVVRSQRRDALKTFLAGKGIETGIHYPIALAKLRAYAYLGAPDMSAFCNTADSTLLSLPIGEHMSREHVDEVSSAVREFFGR
ncbi:DegT/DnrJ/EryC1/StrS aminotransferase family protein [Geobacter sp. DSM 9736]|uniref:DegT/DnrJ/EryC1/StrS family aminotransferase n=1 Tax=Geobacter sp. DSM 9736 TaxID=1277350 RepID=UPI000B512199|nr:DegT/DnrJ/EryC1/StrS family aminotransferase [Geobacter sp. DSM 9736]SNB45054.1 dTDP-4-amino-4,6-dideoxygalactose transaminase [Geobacter sp. DSM 9736]